jgi:hypothetical protein
MASGMSKWRVSFMFPNGTYGRRVVRARSEEQAREKALETVKGLGAPCRVWCVAWYGW